MKRKKMKKSPGCDQVALDSRQKKQSWRRKWKKRKEEKSTSNHKDKLEAIKRGDQVPFDLQENYLSLQKHKKQNWKRNEEKYAVFWLLRQKK